MRHASRFLLVVTTVLATLAASSAAASVPETGTLAAESSTFDSGTVAATHPRLLFGPEEVEGLRQRVTSGESALAWAKLREKVDSYTTPGHPNYVNPMFVNDPTPVTVREGGLRLGENEDWALYDSIFSQNEMRTWLTDLAFASLVAPDDADRRRYGRHAIELLVELSDHWPGWNRNELGEGDLTTGVALAFDWTYHLMTAEERNLIVGSLVADLEETNPVAPDGNFPAPSVFSCLDRDFFYDQAWFNWTGVCGGGNGLVLLAIEGEEFQRAGEPEEPVPDLEPWMSVARERVFPYFERGFGSQGDGAEGVTYAGYGLHNALPFAFAYERLRGEDPIAGTGLTELAVWLAFEQQPGRGTRFVPRNDSAESLPPLHEVIPMLFNVRPDGVTAWLYDHTVGPQGDAVFTSDPVFVADPLTGNQTCTDRVEDPNRFFACWRSAEVFTILYHQAPDELPRTDPSEVADRSRFYPEYGLVNLRTGWEDGTGEVLATFEAKHDHPGGHFQEDMGSFTLYGYGDRFALDSGYGSNYSCDDFVLHTLQGCSRRDARMDNGRAEGHNVPIVGEWRDRGRRTQWEFAVGARKQDTIGTYVDSPDRTLVRSDLSMAYDVNDDRQPGDVRYAERDLVFSRTPGQPVILAVADRLDLDGTPHDYEWQMHTDGANVVTADGAGGFTIRAPSGGTLTAAVTDAGGARRIDLEPWPHVVYTLFDQPLTHTVIVSEDDQDQRHVAMEHLAVLALTAPGEDAAGVSTLEVVGGNVVSVTWEGGEALVASAAYGSFGVSSDRLATDGDVAQVTVLPDAADGPPAVARERRCAALRPEVARGDGPGCGPQAETVLAAGASLTVDGRVYVEVGGGPATVVVSGDTIRAVGPDGATYRVLAPQPIETVTVGGDPVPYTRDGDHIVFSG
ncbi:MAG: hypothetical protein KY437_00460 [Actinobacteria bacterium]|nr:hypothetical protein [Actinomycetota bacterium]